MPERSPTPLLRPRRARRAGSATGRPGPGARSLLQRWALLLFGLFVAVPVLAAGSPTPRALTQVTVQRWLEVASHATQDDPAMSPEAEVDVGDDLDDEDSDLDDEATPVHTFAPTSLPELTAPRSARLAAAQALRHEPAHASRDALRARGPPAAYARA